ncbi:hypothetical protein IGI39_003676 [Enterococcus sp. AZ135]
MIEIIIEFFSSLIRWAIEFFGQTIDVVSDILVYLFSAQL